MNDIPDRRSSDLQLERHSEEMATKLSAIAQTQSEHLSKYHANLEPGEAKALVDEHVSMVADTTLLVTLVAGEEIMDNFTGHPTGRRSPGIAEWVEVLEFNANGGRGLSIRTRDKLIIIAANGVIAAVIAGIALAA